MKKIKLALVSFLLINLVGCVGTQIKPSNNTPTINIEQPEPLKLNSVQWIILTKDNYEQILKTSENKNGLVFLVALDEAGYKNLASNHSKVLRYIREQRGVIAAYKKYYETTKQK